MSDKICVICSDGVEEMELIVPIDIFRRAGIVSEIISAEATPSVTSAHNVVIVADGMLADVNVDDFGVLVVPGGPSSFKKQPLRVELVRQFYKKNKLICAICAAPIILHEAGVLDGKKFCCHPCVYDSLKAANRDARVVVDENLITAKGPGVAAEFALEIVRYTKGDPAANKVKEEMFL